MSTLLAANAIPQEFPCLRTSGTRTRPLQPSPVSLPLPTPVRADVLEHELQGYKDISYVIAGFRNGFSLGYTGPLKHKKTRNSPSVFQHETVVKEILQWERDQQKIIGPFTSPPFDRYLMHPLHLVTRSTGKFRLIHNLSSPRGFSLNDRIPQALRTVRYQNIQDALRLIRHLGRGCFLAKCDLFQAFRMCPLPEREYPLTVFKFKNEYYYDRSLMMGAGSACLTFSKVSDSLQWWIQEKHDGVYCVKVLDDFLFLASSEDMLFTALHSFLAMCKRTGIPVNDEKTVWPTNVLLFLGVELDTNKMEARLDRKKLCRLVGLLRDFRKARKVTLKAIQQLAGLLNWVCAVVLPGRPFLRSIIDLSIGLKYALAKRKLTSQVKADIDIWLMFLKCYNGVSVFHSQLKAQVHGLLTADASDIGFGFFHGDSWSFGFWSHPSYKACPIHIREIFAVYVCLLVFSSNRPNCSVLLLCDNTAVVSSLQKMSCKDPAMMRFVRKIVLLLLRNNIVCSFEHVSSAENRASDLLSRGRVHEFLMSFPKANRDPSPLPRAASPKVLLSVS